MVVGLYKHNTPGAVGLLIGLTRAEIQEHLLAGKRLEIQVCAALSKLPASVRVGEIAIISGDTEGAIATKLEAGGRMERNAVINDPEGLRRNQ